VSEPEQPAAPAPLCWWAPSGPSRPPGALELAAWAALLAWLWISRWTVCPGVLYEWDSVNYALGAADFDVFNHQPHPPGYPLYTLLLRCLGVLTPGSETAPFLLANGLFGSATLLLMGWMLRRHLGPAGALLAAATFSVCPQFWHQGAVSTAYVAECFCSVGCMAVALALVRRELRPAPAALVAALLLGVRPSGALSFMPLLLLALYMSWPGWRGLLVAAATFSGGCALWFFPMVALGEGWARYWEATSALYAWQQDTMASVSAVYNGSVLLRFLTDGMNLLLVALLLNAAAAVAVARGPGWRRTCALLAAWFLPGASIYTFYHLAKSGYVLTLMPISFVATGLALGAATRALPRRWARGLLAINGVVLALYLALNISAFYLAVPAELHRHRAARIPLPNPVLLLGDYGRLGLQYQTYPQRQIKRIIGSLDRDRDLVLFLFGAHELHRIAMFHHPDHRIIATSLGHLRALSRPRSAHWPGSFGEFQTDVLRPMQHEPSPPRATCVHALYDRLVLGRGGTELELPLGRAARPRRLIIVYPAPETRVRLGLGVELEARPHVGGGFHAVEVTTPGLKESLAIQDNDAGERLRACFERPDGAAAAARR